MKPLLIVFSLLILTVNTAIGQTMDTTFQKIIDTKLIEKKQLKEFQEILNKIENNSNTKYLYALFHAEYKKLTGHNYSPVGTYINFGEEKPVPSEQAIINEELLKHLSKLKLTGLISESQFEKFNNKISNNEYVHILQLLPAIIEQVALKEHMNTEKLKVFADKLKSKNIVTTNYNKLISDIEQEELQNPIDFLNYCDKAVIINEQDYPNEPEKYLELIHQKTASIIPELAFTNFEFQIVPDTLISDSESKFFNFIVSLISNEKKYKQKSFYQLYSPGKDEYFGNKIDQQEYYKIFNKILADLQSTYRLHEVKAYNGNSVESKVFGIIALTKEQADLLHGGGVYFSPSYENFKNTFTSDKIEKAIQDYHEIGLLSHLTSDQIEEAKAKVGHQENNTLNDVLIAFPDVIHMFDAELANLQDPYAELIREYKRISHNDFNPIEISDNFRINKNKKVEVKFKIGRNSYRKIFKIESDWIDPDFFEFVKSVVIENKLKGQFYELYTGGQEVGIIYLTKEQYEFLKKNKLLLFSDDWLSEEE